MTSNLIQFKLAIFDFISFPLGVSISNVCFANVQYRRQLYSKTNSRAH